jgi:hypothetical protein
MRGLSRKYFIRMLTWSLGRTDRPVVRVGQRPAVRSPSDPAVSLPSPGRAAGDVLTAEPSKLLTALGANPLLANPPP